MDANERRARASHEAAQWWNRLSLVQPDEISKVDREQFTHWLRESPLHVAELLRIAHVHDALEHFKGWGEIEISDAASSSNVVSLRDADEDHAGSSFAEELDERSRERLAMRPRRRRAWAIAASACFLAVAAAWIFATRAHVIDTTLAERRQVMLDDGSVVQLEPETRLRVEFEDSQRSIALEQGRALFRVARDARRPFWVSANGVSVRAVGTEFGVEASHGGIIVTVAEGKVAVIRAGAAQQAERPQADAADAGPGAVAQLPSPEVFLSAGQQLTMQGMGATEQVRSVDTERALAWAQGQLVFEDATLADVVAEFNRYNLTQLRVDDSALATRRVSGVFEATDIETLLAFVSQGGGGVRITRTGRSVVIGLGSGSAASDGSIQ